MKRSYLSRRTCVSCGSSFTFIYPNFASQVMTPLTCQRCKMLAEKQATTVPVQPVIVVPTPTQEIARETNDSDKVVVEPENDKTEKEKVEKVTDSEPDLTWDKNTSKARMMEILDVHGVKYEKSFTKKELMVLLGEISYE